MTAEEKADVKFRATMLQGATHAFSALRGYADVADSRISIFGKTLTIALKNPQFLTAEMASCVLCPLWVEAAGRCGLEPIDLLTFDEENEIVHPPQLLRNLGQQDLAALLEHALQLLNAAEWLKLWTLLKDALGVQIVAK